MRQLLSILLIFLCLSCSIPGKSQEQKPLPYHSISLSHGRTTHLRVKIWARATAEELKAYGSGMANFLSWISTGEMGPVYDPVKIIVTSYSGANYLTYRNLLTEYTMVGGAIGMESINIRTNIDGDIDRSTIRHINAVGEMNFVFLNRKHTMLYSGMGIGFGREKITYEPGKLAYIDKDILFKGNLTLLGIWISNEFGFFFEIGYGYKGMFNFGFSIDL